jgi:hypothetical protein
MCLLPFSYVVISYKYPCLYLYIAIILALCLHFYNISSMKYSLPLLLTKMSTALNYLVITKILTQHC